MTIENPHAEAGKAALNRFKELVSSLEGWNFVNEAEDVKIYNQLFDGSPIPAIRGESVFLGHKYTPQQILSVANSPGCRKYWDERFDSAEIKDIYSRYESLVWAKTKAPWPIYPRDMSVTLFREFNEDECYVVMTSVEDEKVPEAYGFVRAKLLLSGWKVFKTDEGVGIIYITQIDLAGYIPYAFLKTLESQIPLCVSKVIKYAEDFGFPPHVTEGNVLVKTEDFDNDSKVYTTSFEGIDGHVTYAVSNHMYSNAFEVKTTPKVTVEVEQKANISYVKLTNVSGLVSIEIKGK